MKDSECSRADNLVSIWSWLCVMFFLRGSLFVPPALLCVRLIALSVLAYSRRVHLFASL
jgi:hypothetical protein